MRRCKAATKWDKNHHKKMQLLFCISWNLCFFCFEPTSVLRDPSCRTLSLLRNWTHRGSLQTRSILAHTHQRAHGRAFTPVLHQASTIPPAPPVMGTQDSSVCVWLSRDCIQKFNTDTWTLSFSLLPLATVQRAPSPTSNEAVFSPRHCLSQSSTDVLHITSESTTHESNLSDSSVPF